MSYLVNLAIEARLAVVIGGGEIAARKIADLLAAGACVTVVAVEACDAILALAAEKKIVLRRRAYLQDDLEGAFAAIAATDDEELNRRVAADAGRLHVIINVVDRPALCTFTVPATLHRGDLTIAVATQGRSPALAGILREELQGRYGPEYAGLVSLFGELRERMMARAWDGKSIRQKLADLYRGGALDYLKSGDQSALRDFLRAHVGPDVSPL